MTTLSRLIAAATLVSATAFSPALAYADEGRDHDGYDRYDHAERYDRDDRERLAQPDPWAPPIAQPCDHDRDPRYLPPPPPPRGASYDRGDLGWEGRAWVNAGWRAREQRARFLEAQQVRHELRELEAERAEAHARLAYRPRRLARVEFYLDARRDQLERRLQALTWVAWR